MSKTRKQRRLEARNKQGEETVIVSKDDGPTGIAGIYEKKYKLLLIIPIVMLIAALVQLGVQYSTTGDFLNKGISLKGGLSLTVLVGDEISANDLQSYLTQGYPGVDISVRHRIQSGSNMGYLIESDLNVNDKELVGRFVSDVFNHIGEPESEETYSLEGIGSSLGEQFFTQTITALGIAFLCMGIVVFIYFRTFAPSLAVILAAFSDIVITLSIVNLLGIKLSTAGIAAFLMLIGYSVDTDILLTTKVIKRRTGTVMSRVYSAMKTGITMNFSSMAAIMVAMIFTTSDTIQQIMLILFIGLLVDMINTWIQNVAILRIYLERVKKHD
ncbi:protein translocase subunit SecF [Candidatus Woesearchaeota archaeon]|nr:protein translocase subunit SecF [Candidatus Woesearchaeota archaeon]